MLDHEPVHQFVRHRVGPRVAEHEVLWTRQHHAVVLAHGDRTRRANLLDRQPCDAAEVGGARDDRHHDRRLARDRPEGKLEGRQGTLQHPFEVRQQHFVGAGTQPHLHPTCRQQVRLRVGQHGVIGIDQFQQGLGAIPQAVGHEWRTGYTLQGDPRGAPASGEKINGALEPFDCGRSRQLRAQRSKVRLGTGDVFPGQAREQVGDDGACRIRRSGAMRWASHGGPPEEDSAHHARGDECPPRAHRIPIATRLCHGHARPRGRRRGGVATILCDRPHRPVPARSTGSPLSPALAQRFARALPASPPRRWVAAGALVLGLASASVWLASWSVRPRAAPPVPLPSLQGPAPRLAHTETTATMARAALRSGRIVGQALHLVRTRYVDPARIEPPQMFESALQAIAHEIPEMLVDAPVRRSSGQPVELRVRIADAAHCVQLGNATDTFRLGWALLDTLRFVSDHMPADADAAGLEYTAVNGLLKPLDPWSRMLDPDAWRDMQASTGGHFGGLGIVILTQDGLLTVQTVLPGSPAEKAGLLAGDQILQIDGEDTLNLGVDDAVDRLRGQVGSRALLLVRRAGLKQPRELAVVRAVIHLQSVEWKVLDTGVGYAKVKGFQRGTADELRQALTDLDRAGAQGGLVLDLRDNPGGLLDEAVRIVDLFVARGPAVITVTGGRRQRDVRTVSGRGPWTRLPLAVLLSGHSASASEVVAGALKYSGRAIVVGEQSFGKGSVQVPFEVGGGALKLTVAKYLVPGDVSIHGVGITPDVAVQFVSATREQVSLFGASRFGRRATRALVQPDATGPAELPRTQWKVLLPDAWSGVAPEVAQETPLDVMEREPRQRAALLLRRAGDANAAQFLKAAAPDLAELQRLDDLMLVAHLRRQGIDWRAASEPAEPTVRVEIPAGADGLQIDAGGVLRFSVTLTHTGKVPLHRLHVLTTCDDPALDGHEQLVGQLDPGQSRTVHLRVRIPSRHGSLRVPLRVEAASDGRLLGRRAVASVTILGKPLPEFAFKVTLDDAAPTRPGDGVVQPGEAARLRIDVHNRGTGATLAAGVSVRVAGVARLHLDEGRVRLGVVPPDGRAVATFGVRGLDRKGTGAVAAVDDAEPIRLEVTLADDVLAIERKVPIDLAWSRVGLERATSAARRQAEATRKAAGDVWDAPPRIQFLDGHGEPVDAPRSPVTEPCSIDVGGVALFDIGSAARRFVTASVGGIKQSYHAGRGGAEVPFRARLRLDSGLNTITIQARAGPRQVAQRTLLVACTGTPAAAP
ncbi:MAG: PDZ domain-containing protein [Myxococcales bacterium]|nr:PDZ domain-containing protein [Myxococcales bacterium]